MTRLGLWPVLLFLAGCGSGPQDNSPQAVCRRQAYDDPTVKLLIVQGMQLPATNPQNQFDYNMALRKAIDACLRQRGLPVPGGVEPVRP